jgi:hypothetical protein
MSSIDSTTRPEHHVHSSSDPLPGARGAQAGAVDYSPETIERLPASNLREEGAPATHGEQNAFNSERPMNVQPAPGGEYRKSSFP